MTVRTGNNAMGEHEIPLPCDGPNCPGKAPTQHKCGRCYSSYYCSLQCQKDDWIAHKSVCVDYAEKSRELLRPQPVFEVPTSGMNVTCGVCDRSPIDGIVILDENEKCQHAFCAKCLQKHDMANAEKAAEGEEKESEKKVPPCPVCKAARTKSADEVIFDRTRMYQANSKHVDLNDAERKENLEEAIKEVTKILDAGGGINSAGTFVFGQADQQVFPEDVIGLAAAWKIELLTEAGRPEVASELSKRALSKKYGESTMNRIWLATGKSQETRGQWGVALQSYTSSLLPSPGEEQKGVSEEQVPLLLGRSRTHLKLGNIDQAVADGETAFSANRRLAGVHKNLAIVLKEKGDLDAARRVMDLAIAYEEPWNHDNRDDNIAFRNQLSPEELLKEELRRKEEAFLQVWDRVLTLADNKESGEYTSWSSLKTSAKYDIQGVSLEDAVEEYEEEERDEETQRILDTAARKALQVEEDVDTDVAYDDSGKEAKPWAWTTPDTPDSSTHPNFDKIQLSGQMDKWRRTAEPKYWNFFVDRIELLASGHRSHKYAKRLVGPKNSIIYETYLDSNQRILWTETKDKNMLIWCVAMHDDVNTMMKKIDESESRSMRRMTTASALDDFAMPVVAENGKILLDPLTDTPLRLYDVARDELPQLRSTDTWNPPLHLTEQERQVVEKEGTVLLLGRSGTGKTICIRSRIDHDRHRNQDNKKFSQLFVARSSRICEYVESISSGRIDDDARKVTHYKTFMKLLQSCEAAISEHGGERFDFDSLKRVDFQRFKRDFGPVVEKSGIDLLIVWTQIRSFIKGSIQAVIRGRAITLDEYLDETIFGKRRCRLTREQRKACYEAYERYNAITRGEGLWDDTDRIVALLRGLKSNEEALGQVCYHNVYVDEVQDYTQAEIALFFTLVPNLGDNDGSGLFLAGDPAQSVVEGVEFRFEEVRSVAYELFQLKPPEVRNNSGKRQKFIPSKPMKVMVNFRSHAGVLNVASAVLDRLFGAFPDSAPDLGKDLGVFLGPRPAVLDNMNWEKLKDVASKIDGVVLLTMYDHHVQRLKDLVAANAKKATVLSIRESKGLEFPDIILVDFFKELASEHQKPWRTLLVGDASKDPSFKEQYPEIETQLKQLYTAVTRCSKRFYVAETEKSIAGASFAKWTVKLQLTVQQSAMEVKGNIFTTDQWNAAGVDFAANSETRDTFDSATYFLRQAINYFEQADNADLLQKASLHLESLTFREELATTAPDKLSTVDVESRGVELLAKLMAESVLKMEAHKMYEALKPLLSAYTREQLDSRLVPLLPSLDA